MGHVHIIHDFYSYPESLPRTIRIFTPAEYDRDLSRRFPVLYMHDGQNIFDHPESALWHTLRANVVVERLAESGTIQPWIIVGVDHLPNRLEEYSPWDEPFFGARGLGPQYGDFLVNHLKPYIDRTYRTLPEPQWTATMGSSMGGLISIWLGHEYPHVFGRVGGVSSTLSWSNGRIFQYFNRRTEGWCKIWLDTGSEEKGWYDGMFLDYRRLAEDFHNHLKGLGYGDHELRLFVEPGGNHHEIDWQRRLPEIMSWLLENAAGI